MILDQPSANEQSEEYRIPDLEFDCFVGYFNRKRPEFNADSDLMVDFEIIFHYSWEQAGFPNTFNMRSISYLYLQWWWA